MQPWGVDDDACSLRYRNDNLFAMRITGSQGRVLRTVFRDCGDLEPNTGSTDRNDSSIHELAGGNSRNVSLKTLGRLISQ